MVDAAESAKAGPANLEAEGAILGSILLNERVLVNAREILVADDFFADRHRLIYEAMLTLADRGSPVDAFTLAAELGSKLEHAGGHGYLAELGDGLPRASNIGPHCRIVKECALRRRLARAAEDAREAALVGEADRHAIVGTLRANLDSITEDGVEPRIQPVDLEDLLKMDIPPRKWILDGLMQERDLAMLHAYRGLGKSRVAHGLAVAVASGGRFLRWAAPSSRGVLILDGELPREDLQAMLAQAVLASGQSKTAPLRVLSADLCGGPLRSLATAAGRRQVELHLDGVSLLVVDSISTLCPGAGPENDSESWEQMQAWLLELRRQGVATLLVHHDGKAGRQRGTSKREDVLSQVIQLRRPPDYKPSEGCRVEVHFTKSRGLTGQATEPFEALLTTDAAGKPAWTFRSLADVRGRQVKELSDDGLTQREIAQELGIGLGTVNRALKRARERWGSADITDGEGDH